MLAPSLVMSQVVHKNTRDLQLNNRSGSAAETLLLVRHTGRGTLDCMQLPENCGSRALERPGRCRQKELARVLRA